MRKSIKILISLRDWVDARFPLMKIWNERAKIKFVPAIFIVITFTQVPLYNYSVNQI